MSGNQYKAYFGRYYVLVVLSLLAAHQNLTWATFSPIADEAKRYYALTDDDLALLPAYSPMCFVLLTIPFAWLLQKLGLQFIGVSGAWLLAIGCIIRCFIPYAPNSSNWLWVMHIAHVLIGYVGLPIMILPPRVSSVWFKPKERTFATSVSVTAQGIGSALAFVMNSYLTEQYDIRTMLYVHAEIGVFIALLFTIYFPSAPPTPPSESAQEERTEFLKSFKVLFTKPSYIILIISGGVFTGTFFGFGSVLSVILNKSVGFNDRVTVNSVTQFFSSTSWMGFVSSLLGTIFGQCIGLYADKFQRKFKSILTLLIICSTISICWFALSIYGWGWNNTINLFISYTACNIFIISAMPIYYEAAVETTYPITEGLSGGLLTLLINIGTLLFSVIGIAGVFDDRYPERAKLMSWVTVGSSLIAFVAILLYVERYERLSVDDSEERHEKSPLIN